MEKQSILFPKMQRQLELVGENIKLARLRRKFTSQQVAERAGISLENLSKIENGHWIKKKLIVFYTYPMSMMLIL